MVRRLILGAAVGLLMMAGTAAAQDSPGPTTTVAPTTTTVAPTTTEQPTTTTEESTTTSVLGTVVTNPPEAPTTAPTVGGVVVPRPLPRTGSDVGIQVVAGASLTAAGLAFAAMARLRRHRASNPAAT